MEVNELLEEILMALRKDSRIKPFGASMDHGNQKLSVTFEIDDKSETFTITAKKDEA